MHHRHEPSGTRLEIGLIMAGIIGSVVFTPTQAVPGQSVLVEAVAPDSSPLVDQVGTVVRINGVTGARQYLQFPWAGEFVLRLDAWRGEAGTDSAEASFVVAGDAVELPQSDVGSHIRALSLESATGVPVLRIAHTPGTPTTVGLSIGRSSRFSAGLTTNVDRPPDGLFRKAIVDAEVSAAGVLAESPLRGVSPTQITATTYTWDFGDGSKLMTTEPNVEHDFAASLGPDEEHRLFDVRVTVAGATETPVEFVRTLSIYNDYAICKALGTIVPRSRASGYATKVLDGYTMSIAVDNIEDVPITLTDRLITPVLPDGNDLALPVRSEEMSEPIIVSAHGTAFIAITVDKDAVPKEAHAVAVLFAGQTERGEPVRVEAYAEISHEDQTSDGLKLGNIAVTHLPQFREALEELIKHPSPPDEDRPLEPLDISRGVVTELGGSGRFSVAQQSTPALRLGNLQTLQNVTGTRIRPLSESQLDRMQVQLSNSFSVVAGSAIELQNRGGTPFDLAPIRALFETKLIDPHIFDFLETEVPQEGMECSPDNVPDDVGDWVCQATPQRREEIVPGRFMNARKGDIILSPGGMGPIGGLLRSVMPPQRYSHSGIMTRNYDTITHSTASEDRLRDYPVGSILGDPYPTEGHRPDVVKYGWPGVVTQPVEEAIHGGQMVDPESGKSYSISSFSSRNAFMEVGGVWEVVPPIVVKPDPMQETPQLRRTLHRVADAAAASAGKSHYRFFCYTDPTIGESTTAPPEAGWAANTFPSVCSSFIWLMLKQAGVKLEADSATVARSDLEPVDIAAGAQVDGNTKDGLYLYTAEERRAAGNYLFGYLHDKVRATEGEEGFLGELAETFSDMADDVANQMVNAFASDWCDEAAKDSDKWKTPGNANAISPDNILLWDGPESGGLYGFATPLVYHEPRREMITVHKWKLVPTKGVLTGTVRHNGAPVAGAMVQLYDGKTAFTNASGRYRLEAVPFGAYQVKAAKDGGPVYLTAEIPFNLDSPEASLDIELNGPSQDFRMLKISGNIHMLDYEDFGPAERGDQPIYAELFIGPYNTHAEHTFVGKCGGEVRVEFRIVADWQLDRSMGVYYEHKFFEGASEDTDDLDGYTDKGFGLAAGFWQSWNSNITSGGAGESHISVTFENALNPN